jgi:CHASE2 domain-containing sensor protein
MGHTFFQPSHFMAVVLFALFASIVFGITQRETPRRMIRYGIYCFVLFVGSTIAISWLMFLVAR